MRNILKRAWRDTLAVLGLSDFSLIRIVLSVVVSALFVGLIWHWRGEPEALTEVSDIAFYGMAFVSVAVLLFLYNLWLAPYKILKEAIDNIPKSRGITAQGSLGQDFNIKNWEGIRVYQLGDAACLWVSIPPHEPIESEKAFAMFKRLSGAVVSGQLKCNAGWGGLNSFLRGEAWWPRHGQMVLAVSLRRYADDIGDVPPFLQSVEVPLEEEPTKESGTNDNGSV